MNINSLKERLRQFSPRQIFLIKYGFSIVLTAMTMKMLTNQFFLLASFLELLIIHILSNALFVWKPRVAKTINNILVLLYNIEQLSMVFAGTYISSVMLSNVDSLQALSGKMSTYVLATIVVLVFSFLPTYYICYKNSVNLIFTFLASVGLFSLFVFKRIDNSPYYNFYLLVEQRIEYYKIQKKIKEKAKGISIKFKKEHIDDGLSRPIDLAEKPNIILIFTEGLSQSIIDDNRNLLPAVRDIQQQSINFKDYYNHTFATYAGLIGQLYSGYQLNNYDTNHLVSIESILSREGYQTAFINTEPNNKEFTTYLNNLKYDKVITKKSKDTLSDKIAYELLFDTSLKMRENSRPFFLSIYTFGTHVSLDSPDAMFGDGSDPMLNKFRNLDKQFQTFITKFEESDLSENTILIFTTDHATYVDESYVQSFGHNRAVGNLDKVPFFIYYKGMDPKTVDAYGRNSLALAPTILDFIDIDAENYFLGESLFTEHYPMFGQIFYSEGKMFTTNEAQINFVDEKTERELKSVLEDYFAARSYQLPN